MTMYKKFDELIQMTPQEVAAYVARLEATDEVAKNNGLEYIEWCGEDLDNYLTANEIGPEEFGEMLREI
jgi:hypothetical protein